ncbi:hypothetical protein N836_31385 [Leptolyngbya sp. Heron Island J]|uniref:hypothetical protein n=1 Tax=Leptolyngbya sp. Heron Island J TaxID=1385935 RepID=UPI0003B9E291|nr:hypothetical protein [Leptolyngbya sp. Heron Island J]ESA38445.1 hypothetical protein N836_31385 [Leptolyngbya sp. Heron Island J]
MAAIDRVLEATKQRRQATLQLITQRSDLPVEEIYAGDRRFRQVGATGGYLGRNRPKRISRSIGESVDSLLSGESGDVDDQELRRIVDDLSQALRVVANRRGILLYQGDEATNPNDDPNDEDNEGENRAYQQYDNQLVATGSEPREGALYRHVPATATEPEKFVPVAMHEDQHGQIQSPTVSQTICVITGAEYRSKITKFSLKLVGGATVTTRVDDDTNLTVGTSPDETTVTFSQGIGTVIDKDQSLEFTVTATNGSAIAWSVGYTKI